MIPSFFKKLGPINIEQITSVIDCDLVNIKKDEVFIDFVSLDKIKERSLSFLYDSEKVNNNFISSVGLICTKRKIQNLKSNNKYLIVKNVQESAATISNIFYRNFNIDEIREFPKPVIGKDCEIGNNVVIENGVTIGNNVKIEHGSTIKHNCIIGDGTYIGSNATIQNSILGESVYIGSNTSIGQRGFGFYLKKNKNIDIYHIGRVIIKSNVSIGSCCTIDRGSFSDTLIGENTYIDNLCHVAHNVEIGNNCAFAAMTGIAGSAKIGNNVLTGGQAGIAGHITVGNNVRIAAKSGVFHNLNDGEAVMGNPATNQYKFLKNYKKIYGKKTN